MAKTKLTNEEGELRMDDNQGEKTGTQRTEATISNEKKNVRVRVVDDIDCIIACKPYKFSKDKEVLVPSDVAAILCYANKAYRL